MTTRDSSPFNEGPAPRFSQKRQEPPPASPAPQPRSGPLAAGLYDPIHEHDACGVGFVVDIKGRRSHAIVEQALQVLINLLHRGACGCEANTGDGAGILIQMPDAFLRKVTAPLGITLPPAGDYGAGLVFLPRDADARATRSRQLFERIVAEEGQRLLGWRDVPTDDRAARRIGAVASSRCSSRCSSAAARRSTRPTRDARSRASSASCT